MRCHAERLGHSEAALASVEADSQRGGRCRKPSIQSPQARAGDNRRRQQVNVNPAQPATPKATGVEEGDDLSMSRRWKVGKLFQQGDCLRAAAQGSARELPDDEIVAADQPGFEEGAQVRAIVAKMRNPDGAVREDHRRLGRARLRGALRAAGSVPPNEASRLALSRAISASSPA